MGTTSMTDDEGPGLINDLQTGHLQMRQTVCNFSMMKDDPIYGLNTDFPRWPVPEIFQFRILFNGF